MTPRLIKERGDTTVSLLHTLFNKVWEEEKVPGQLKMGIIVKFSKKGDLTQRNN